MEENPVRRRGGFKTKSSSSARRFLSRQSKCCLFLVKINFLYSEFTKIFNYRKCRTLNIRHSEFISESEVFAIFFFSNHCLV